MTLLLSLMFFGLGKKTKNHFHRLLCARRPHSISRAISNGVLQIIIISSISILNAISTFKLCLFSHSKTTFDFYTPTQPTFTESLVYRKKNKRANTQIAMNKREKKRFVSAICRSPSCRSFAPMLSSIIIDEKRRKSQIKMYSQKNVLT